MNIALGAVILILLLLPAISFKYGINRNPDLKELFASVSITDSFWVFLFVPISLHLLTIFVFHYFNIGHEIKFDVFYKTIIGEKELIVVNSEFSHYTLGFLAYTIVCFIIAYFIGLLFAFFETRPELKYLSVSYILGLTNNKWYTLFDADIMANELNKEVDFIFIDVLSNTKETTTIYSGILYNYHFKQNSKELGYLILKNAVRRDMRKEYVINKPVSSTIQAVNTYSSDMGPNVEIQGDLFIIPHEQIININVTYIKATTPESFLEWLRNR